MSVDPKSGLTLDELEVMEKLTEAYKAFLKLPRQHPDEVRDFVDGIHRCQDTLAVRIVRRHYPQFWPTHQSRED